MRKAMNIICGILAELCALAVIFLGAYLAYDAKASSLDQSYVSHRQEQVSHRKIHKATPGKTATMRHTDPPAEAEPGDGELFAYLRVPSWGKQYRLPIWQGTAKTVLDEMGAGHYDTTAMPGQVGNSSLAGHNTYADMADIRLLKPGDVVYIETGSYWYRYRINSNPEIVDQLRTDVIDQDAAGVERGLTLQTCWPIMTGGNVTHRLIVHGGLDGWAPKTTACQPNTRKRPTRRSTRSAAGSSPSARRRTCQSRECSASAPSSSGSCSTPSDGCARTDA